MRIGDLVQSKRYKILGVIVAKGQNRATLQDYVTILWLDKNTKTTEYPNDVIKLHKNT